MKKAGKFGLFLLIGGAFLTSLGLYAQDKENTSASFRPIIFSSIEGRQWVERCVEQHPEILWLADANVRKTEEGQATLQGTYSEQLFGQKYIEFDRTIMTIHCLKLILNGSDKAYKDNSSTQNSIDKQELKDLFDLMEFSRVSIIKMLMLDEISFQEYCQIPMSRRKYESDAERTEADKARETKSKQFFEEKIYLSPKSMFAYTDFAEYLTDATHSKLPSVTYR